MVSKRDFDETVFNAIKDLMEERFGILAEKYTRNADLYVQGADAAMRAGDAEKIAQNVHALKSSSAMLGFIGFQRCAVEIEAKARRGDTDLRDDLARLKDYLHHSYVMLEPYLEVR